MMPLLLHVGFHKTATTWLQRRFFSDSRLFYTVMDHADVDRWLLRPHPLDFDPQAAAREADRRLEGIDDPARIPVISSELLCGNPFYGSRDNVMLAERLRAAFGDARILITIRNQLDILPSTYKQYLTRGGVLPPERFFAPDLPPGYVGFDAMPFEFHRLVSVYQRLFGPRNVCVLPYEEFSRDARVFCRKILEFTGRGDIETLAVDASARDGVGPPERAFPWLRFANRLRGGVVNPSPCLPLKWIGDTAFRGGVWVGRRLPRPARSELRELVAHRFAERFAGSNRELARLCGIDLQAFGYPWPTGSAAGVRADDRSLALQG